MWRLCYFFRGKSILIIFHKIVANTWCMILLINSSSRTLPPTFIRLISLYLDASCTFPLPGLIPGIILDFFHLLGKFPACSYTLYIVY